MYTQGYEPLHYFTLLIRDIQKAAKLVRSPRRKEIKHVTKTIYIQVCTGRLVVTETHSKNAVPRNVGKFDQKYIKVCCDSYVPHSHVGKN